MYTAPPSFVVKMIFVVRITSAAKASLEGESWMGVVPNLARLTNQAQEKLLRSTTINDSAQQTSTLLGIRTSI